MGIGNSINTPDFAQTIINGTNNPDIVNLIQQVGLDGFLLLVTMGEVPGATYIAKFGENPDVDTGTTPEDIWSQGGLYNFSNSPIIDTISSSNASDTEPIIIFGLDSNWDLVQQEITLNGQNKVSLTTSLIRVYRMINNGSNDLQGTVYVYEDTAISSGVPTDTTKIRAVINNGDNQTLMSIFSVPQNSKAYLINGYITAGRTATSVVTASLRVRPFGSVFQTKLRISIDTSASSTWNFQSFSQVPEKSDILVRVESVSNNNTGVTAGYSVLIIDD